MFKHILLPTDGTAASLKAARLAVILARRCGARLSVLHVVAPPRMRRHRSNGCLAQVTELVEAEGGACTAVEIMDDAPDRAITAFADEHDCDLIVMGSHGKHGLQRLVLGSETQKVLMHSRRPILVCP